MTAGERPLLIVNADDWGMTRAATEAILACIEAGTVTSTSAMVHMADSERAATLAHEHGLSVGLHLNLTEPFTGESVPPAVRERQAAVARAFRGGRWAVYGYDPRLSRAARACVNDQLEAFHALYGRAPVHLNGHHHIHTSPNVLLCGALPRGQRLRRTFTFFPGEKPALNRMYRGMLNRAMASRFPGTRYFVHLESFMRFAGDGTLAAQAPGPIEVMTHPEWDEERQLLGGTAFRGATEGYQLGSYDLIR